MQHPPSHKLTHRSWGCPGRGSLVTSKGSSISSLLHLCMKVTGIAYKEPRKDYASQGSRARWPDENHSSTPTKPRFTWTSYYLLCCLLVSWASHCHLPCESVEGILINLWNADLHRWAQYVLTTAITLLIFYLSIYILCFFILKQFSGESFIWVHSLRVQCSRKVWWQERL